MRILFLILALLMACILVRSSVWSFKKNRDSSGQDKMIKASFFVDEERSQCPSSSKIQSIPDETEIEPSPTATSTQEQKGQTFGFAYLFYATSDAYACSALVNIHRLRKLKAKYPIHVLVSSEVGEAYIKSFATFDVPVHIQDVPHLAQGSDAYYKNCLLKLLAFKMHILSPGLRRVLAFDADQLVLKNLDHLFTGLPQVDLAAPRAYWLSKDFLSSTFLLISLSDRLWTTVQAALESIQPGKYDMDLMNDLFGNTVIMLSGEYVTVNSHWEDWNLPDWFHPSNEGFKTMPSIQKSSQMEPQPGMITLGASTRVVVEITFYALRWNYVYSVLAFNKRRTDES